MLDKCDDAVDLALVEPVLEKYKDQKGALIPILQQIQGIYGYLPRPVLEVISRRLRLPMSNIYGVATFYSQFYMERRGRHVLKVCEGTACHIKGAPQLMTAVSEEYGIGPGETTGDGQLTIEIVYCIGSCALAPLTVVDGQVVGRVKGQDLLRRLKRQVAG